MTTISIRGSIIDDDSAWLYEWFGFAHTTAGQFKAQLAAAEDDVVVEINSPGGYVTAAAEIFEAIRAHEGSIECRVVGQAASAASVIACAAKSSITPMGTLFLHNCLGSAEGNHNDMRQAMRAMESVDENIMEAYRAKTGLPDDEIYGLMEENTTLSARRAVELGFIDRITESAADVAQAAGAAPGLAADAGGFVDLMAMDAERLSAMRELYDKAKREQSEGGEEMEDEIMEQVEDEQAEALEAVAEEDPDEEQETETEGEPEEGDDPDEDGEGEPQGASAADYERGVQDERARVAAIMDIAANVPDAMLRDALFANPVNAGELALRAMRAESRAREGYMAKARADVAASRSAEVAAEVSDGGAASEIDKVCAYMKDMK